MSLEKPNENDKQMKPPYKIVFRRKEFFMDYDMYQKLKVRRQGNVVMCCLLGIDAAKHCLPGDRVSGRIPLSKQDVEQICGIATKDFLVFKGESEEKVRSQIGKVCSLAAKGIQFGQQDHEDDANVGGNEESGSSDNENLCD